MPLRRSVYVVGDIHGCHEELLNLEEAVRNDARERGVEAFFVCVGDLIDRGPHSREVVTHVRESVARGTHACVAGNHEALMLEVLLVETPWNFEEGWTLPSRLPAFTPGLAMRQRMEKSREPFSVYRSQSIERWMRCGGRETLRSFGCDAADTSTWKFDRATLEFLVSLPILWENEACVVTHALATQEELTLGRALSLRAKRDPSGYHAALSLDDAHGLDALLWNRECGDEPPDAARVHVTGHTPVERPFRHLETGTVNVDTACVFGNLLTAYCVDTSRFISVPGWSGSPFA